jgi:alpha-tubulin suppressor-like RCC1 family protein
VALARAEATIFLPKTVIPGAFEKFFRRCKQRFFVARIYSDVWPRRRHHFLTSFLQYIMRFHFIPLWAGLSLLCSAGTAAAQASANTFAASTNHTLSIRPDGSLWAWGANLEGQLGDGTTTSHATPVRVLAESPDTRWAQVAAGTSHTLALSADGRLYAWGANADGQLGDGSTAPHHSPAVVALPAALGHAAWKQIAAGTSHSLALTTDGHLYAWGNNTSGELGNGARTDQTTPVEVSLPASAGPTAWAQVAAGTNHTLALTADGRLYAWGSNAWGQLGTGGPEKALLPVALPPPGKGAGTRWAQVAAGRYHTLALSTDGRLYTWGSNRFGQLGESTHAQHSTPQPLELPRSLAQTVWKQVAAGDAHSVALTADGHLYAWGNNCAGQLGDGGVVRQLCPVPVTCPRPVAGGAWAWVVSGGFHTVACTATGELYAWGANRFGQLGDGGVVDQYRPVAAQGVEQHGAGTIETVVQPDNRYMKQVPEPPR